MNTLHSNQTEIESLSDLRAKIYALKHIDEALIVNELKENSTLSPIIRNDIVNTARKLVQASRDMRHKRGTLDAFLQEFGLSNQEGIALMCLAEALLRIPDDETKDKLIAEKIASGQWSEHKGQSDSLLVNASTWALMLTGRVISVERSLQQDIGGWFKKLISRVGEPAIRTAMMQSMRIMGGEFVMGRTIQEAMKRGAKSDKKQMRFSFDMLGEGARTYQDAERYYKSYMNAIESIAKYNNKLTPYDGPGISVKLSALHPNYHYAHEEQIRNELLPDVKRLALAAKQYNMGFTIDAEEADRLDISLDIIEALARDPELKTWNGLGLAVQAYQKRGLAVINWLIALGRETKHQFMVRLVKGAYWDSEIKLAQTHGYKDYPVFTRKVLTDFSYIVCAEHMLAAPDAIYSQFATHNAHTVALILHLAGDHSDYEFQRLHGMGDLLYKAAEKVSGNTPVCRVYAPVGSHEDLLPYLVRRLLENGANSSFVNRFMNAEVPVDELVADPLERIESLPCTRHPQIPLPEDLYGKQRKNSASIDLTDPIILKPLYQTIKTVSQQKWLAAPIVNGQQISGNENPVYNPSDTRQLIGACVEASNDDINNALSSAKQAQARWNQRGGETRAQILLRAADKLEEKMEHFMALAILEAGKTIPDALAEIREGVDFCRYYAELAKKQFSDEIRLPGPTGEDNRLSLHGRGVFLCISPWNFPLAIFTGQVAAALAAGNCVVAKPAEQTPIIAAEMVKLFHECGIPGEVLHFLPGDGLKVGATIVNDTRIDGVAFTGSTETAKAINLSLAKREGPIIPLIAETGGQNAMIVDSTALLEQVVDDVVASAFLSAGQRCSALRVLFVQDEIANKLIEMLSGAIDALTLGNPQKLSSDIGPIIDEQARQTLQKHADHMTKEATLLKRLEPGKQCTHGTFFGPHIFEIKNLDQLGREVFGPVLHVIRYKEKDLHNVIQSINNTGYGLTLGVHSRIEDLADTVYTHSYVGNTYINRDMVGAVVGVQPFGGQGLSGTGPKAGGPHYLLRFATERTRTENTVATGGNAALFCLNEDD